MLLASSRPMEECDSPLPRPPTAEKRGRPRRRNEEGRRETSFSVPSPLFLHHRMGEEIHREWRRGGREGRRRTDQTDELSSSSEGKTRVEKGERGKQKKIRPIVGKG